MSEETNNAEQAGKAPTEEELAARKKELQKFYADELPLLRKQAEYEELITRVDVAKFTRFEIMMQKAHIMSGQKEESQNKPSQSPEEQGEHLRPINKKETINS